MNAGDFEIHFASAVASVLESMFFSEAMGTCEATHETSDLQARVAFSGEVSGVLGVRLSEPSARSLAASFLGEAEDSLDETQIAQVVCELTNMLCGWIVSKAESQGVWELGSPKLVSAHCEEPESIQQSFGVEHGILTLSLCLGVPA